MRLSKTRVEFESFIGKWIFLMCFSLLAVGGFCVLIVAATS